MLRDKTGRCLLLAAELGKREDLFILMYYCPLYSGSSGNCAWIATGRSRLLVDAGLSGKAIETALAALKQNPHALQGILITHEHQDHTRGAGVLSRRLGIPIYANEATWEAMGRDLGKIAPQHRRVFGSNQEFYLGDLEVYPYSISHDAADPVGFAFHHNGRRVVQMTDLGRYDSRIVDIAAGADLVLVEANHDPTLLEQGPYPQHLKRRIRSHQGHLSNQEAGALCGELLNRGTHRFILGHLSGENNSEQLAYDTVCRELHRQGCQVGQQGDAQVFMAHRDRVTEVFRLD